MRIDKRWALASLMALGLSACSGEAEAPEGGAEAAPPSASQTLAVVIGDDGQFDTLEGIVDNAGLADVLEGRGPYTLFAPTAAALGDTGAALSDEAMQAQSAALLRAHIVPGALTRADILAAMEQAGGDEVQMRTMADGMLTFSRDGEAIVVTADDGASARLADDETLASNGVVQPVDAVLVEAG